MSISSWKNHNTGKQTCERENVEEAHRLQVIIKGSGPRNLMKLVPWLHPVTWILHRLCGSGELSKSEANFHAYAHLAGFITFITSQRNKIVM